MLALRGLGRTYRAGDPPALVDLHLDVPAGSCVALLGPSGSGKTTALRLAAGLEAPDTGAVLLDGRDLAGVPPERRGMATVSQRPLLFPHLSVLDNVAFSARVAGTARRRARADAEPYLDLVRLHGFGPRRVGELSGGQAQRVALARALASRPRVLLLDEPFGALDPVLRDDAHALLDRLRRALAPTVLIVTHDPVEAAALADTVAVLAAGRLAQHDTVDRVYARPASLTVSRMLGGRNEVTGVVTGGVHRSPLGALRLPDAGAPDGAAVLLVRPEAIRVATPDDPAADAVGEVTALRTIGPRRSVRVTVTAAEPGDRRTRAGGPPTGASGGGAWVDAEVELGRPVAVGDRVGLVLPLDARAVVPPATGAARPDVGDARSA